MRDKHILKRMLFGLLGVQTLLLALLVATGFFTSYNSDLELMEEIVDHRSRLIAAAMMPGIFYNDRAVLQEVSKDLIEDHSSVEAIVVLNSQEQKLLESYRSELAGKMRCVAGGSRIDTSGLQHYQSLYPVMLNGKQVGSLCVRYDFSDIFDVRLRLLYQKIFFSLLIIGLGVLLSMFLIRKVENRVKNLEKGASELLKGNLSYRIPIQTEDEFSELAETFNHLAVSLKEEKRITEEATERLERSELHYRELIEVAQTGVVRLDSEEKIEFVNPYFAKMIGCSFAELKGLRFADLLESSDKGLFDRKLTEPTTSENGHFDLILKNEGHDPIIVSAILSHLVDEHKNRKGTLVYLSDISLRVQAEAQTKAARDAADFANRAKTHFLANMSHELRTPMNGVIGLVDYLLSSELPDQHKKTLRLVQSSSHALVKMLNDILDLTRIEAERAELIMDAVSLENLVSDSKDLFLGAAAAKQIQLVYQSDLPMDLTVLADGTVLNQILSNLMANAVKFTSNGEVGLEVKRIEEDSQSVKVRFSVWDTGIGIPVEEQERIFDSFYQVDNTHSKQYGGSGLGLAIVNKLATMLQSGIRLQSEVGKGTRFWFDVRFEKTQKKIVEPSENRDDNNYLKNFKGKKILVAEDIELNRIVATKYLMKYGCLVQEAVDGKQALEMVQEGDYDLVLMDCLMPVMDGLTATYEIRQWEKKVGRKPVPIVALTAKAMFEDRKACYDVGMSDFIAKPILGPELEKVLRRYL